MEPVIVNQPLGAPQRGRQLGVAERLQQIVERVHAKRLEREFFVRGDKDDRRHPLGADRADHTEPVDLRHLHVEQDEVGLERFDRLDRRLAVGAVTNGFELRILADQLAQPCAGQGLVVDDEHTQAVHGVGRGAACCAPTSNRNGITSVATAPPSGACSSVKRAAEPYAALRRSRVFLRPTPLETGRGVRTAGPWPSSDPSTINSRPETLALIPIRPAAARALMPCLTALSTSGSRISRGTRAAFACSVRSTRTSSRSAKRTSSTAR